MLGLCWTSKRKPNHLFAFLLRTIKLFGTLPSINLFAMRQRRRSRQVPKRPPRSSQRRTGPRTTRRPRRNGSRAYPRYRPAPKKDRSRRRRSKARATISTPRRHDRPRARRSAESRARGLSCRRGVEMVARAFDLRRRLRSFLGAGRYRGYARDPLRRGLLVVLGPVLRWLERGGLFGTCRDRRLWRIAKRLIDGKVPNNLIVLRRKANK